MHIICKYLGTTECIALDNWGEVYDHFIGTSDLEYAVTTEPGVPAKRYEQSDIEGEFATVERERRDEQRHLDAERSAHRQSW